MDIVEKINSGITIISDRYAYSGVCYSTAKGLNVEWCKNCDKGLPQPDIIFYLYASEEVTSKRGGFGEEIYENNSFQKKVRFEFEGLLRNEKNVVRIDTEKSLDEVHQEIKDHLDVLMQKRLKCELDKLWME
ncbi:thymidylate kinase, putative [Ichthyophthirius multifiliis]|uniref:dTMP kinase n=1 Tax=Ichthyophthirius multifiliis TaxID=5932 RepID=G0QY28_ICHMU|nr:thymidylate kinase, putative [Ichthyophthirius multifiliis]EGR29897.1 thymidylate kinase, putative [Ichthyophthirius multifiliis]|eukprot:XP_004031133.1 thymidylate kinase, putative [Ichthyophthirius multifiliis]